MKLLFFAVLALSSCASPKPRGFELPLAMSELFRNGQLKGLEYAESQDLGMINPTALVSRTCTSVPVFDVWNRYVQTEVYCR